MTRMTPCGDPCHPRNPRLKLQASSSSLRLGAPESNGVGRKIGIGEVAVMQREDSLVIVRPAAPADDAVQSGVRTLRVLLGTESIVVLLVPIAHPFPDVSNHSIESETVGSIRSDRNSAIGIAITRALGRLLL